MTDIVQNESTHRYNLKTFWMTFSVYYTSLLDMGEGWMLSSSQAIWTSLDQIWPVKYHFSIQLNYNNNSSWQSMIAYIIKSLTIYTIHMHGHKYSFALILVLFYTWVFDAYIYPNLFLDLTLYNRVCKAMKNMKGKKNLFLTFTGLRVQERTEIFHSLSIFLVTMDSN